MFSKQARLQFNGIGPVDAPAVAVIRTMIPNTISFERMAVFSPKSFEDFNRIRGRKKGTVSNFCSARNCSLSPFSVPELFADAERADALVKIRSFDAENTGSARDVPV